MKKLSLKVQSKSENEDVFIKILSASTDKDDFIEKGKKVLEDCTIEFYDYIGLIFKHIGIKNPHVTREGDVNCRFDATIIDDVKSIPIEIKSPREVSEINIKSIRQALENKIVILSREFYPSESETTSLAIAFEYPPTRSDVYELITDIKKAFSFNIGIIDLGDLLDLMYEINVNKRVLNRSYFSIFSGRIDNEKALI